MDIAAHSNISISQRHIQPFEGTMRQSTSDLQGIFKRHRRDSRLPRFPMILAMVRACAFRTLAIALQAPANRVTHICEFQVRTESLAQPQHR